MKKFVIHVADNDRYEHGYLKSIYVFQGELFTATVNKSKDARLFNSEKSATRYLNSRENHLFKSFCSIEEVEIAENDEKSDEFNKDRQK